MDLRFKYSTCSSPYSRGIRQIRSPQVVYVIKLMIKRKLSHFGRENRVRERESRMVGREGKVTWTELRSIVSEFDLVRFSNKFIFNMLPCFASPFYTPPLPPSRYYCFSYLYSASLWVFCFSSSNNNNNIKKHKQTARRFCFNEFFFRVFRFRRNLSCLQTTSAKTTIHIMLKFGKNYQIYIRHIYILYIYILYIVLNVAIYLARKLGAQ